MHVLQIDDMIEEHILLEDDLDDGIYLSACLNQEQAEEMLKRKKFDLIVIDINLIIENGYEVAENLKKYNTDILLTSTGLTVSYIVHLNDKLDTISKEKLASVINKKAKEYDRINR